MKEKSIKGITLVALVITIVILLILAGISIQAITNTGLFANAKRAAEESKYANAEEKVKMAVMASYDENAFAYLLSSAALFAFANKKRTRKFTRK